MYNKYNLSNDKMGIRAGLTDNFVYTPKLLLNSPLKATLDNGEVVSLSVEKWIKSNPLHLLFLLRSGKVQLCINAHTRLFSTLEILYPKVYAEYQRDKRMKSAYKKAQAHVRNEEQKRLGK